MWKKVQRTYNLNGDSRRKTFAVRRSRSGNRVAQFVLPSGTTSHPAATVYFDGRDRLAFSFGVSGEYRVRKNGSAQQVTIPTDFASRIPFGTRNCIVMWDDDMLILDLTQFAPNAVAAE